MKLFLYYALIIYLGIVAKCLGESIVIEDQITLSVNNISFYPGQNWQPSTGGTLIFGDTVILSNSMGLLVKYSRDDLWQILVYCEQKGNDWWEDFKQAKKNNALYSPGNIWYLTNNDNPDELVVFDNWIGSLYTIAIRDKDNVDLNIWNKKLDKYYLTSACVWKNNIYYGVSPGFDRNIVATSVYNNREVNILYECPVSLKNKLKEVGTKPFCIPAYVSKDNMIWLAFHYYDYIYLLNTKGNLYDSVKIIANDYRVPNHGPISRMKSNAVFQDWLSRCTPVQAFMYVPPDYIILQYRSGWLNFNNDSLSLQSTLAWCTDKQPVKLDIDRDWRLIGVQPDGRIIFAEYLIENGMFDKTILHVVRIQ